MFVTEIVMEQNQLNSQAPIDEISRGANTFSKCTYVYYNMYYLGIL